MAIAVRNYIFRYIAVRTAPRGAESVTPGKSVREWYGALRTRTGAHGPQLHTVKGALAGASTMSRPDGRDATGEGIETAVETYIKDVRVVETAGDGADYRFEAPLHEPVTFDDLDTARIYADVYFDVNGFREEGTGEHGVPPEIFQGGKDTLAAYLLTRPGVDVNWVASFLGVDRVEVDRYVAWVEDRAATIRERAGEQGVE